MMTTTPLKPAPMFWVRVAGTDDYCLMWGDQSPRWQGTRANADDRAGKLTATSRVGTVYEVVPATSACTTPEVL
jgi:hypothetical protein